MPKPTGYGTRPQTLKFHMYTILHSLYCRPRAALSDSVGEASCWEEVREEAEAEARAALADTYWLHPPLRPRSTLSPLHNYYYITVHSREAHSTRELRELSWAARRPEPDQIRV